MVEFITIKWVCLIAMVVFLALFIKNVLVWGRDPEFFTKELGYCVVSGLLAILMAWFV